MQNRKLLFPYNKRVLSHKKKKSHKLTLFDATSMAVGGMIGGGIFSVLGTTISIAGHAAFLSFIIGGFIALLTARSYSRLSIQSGKSGGPFTYLRGAGFPELGAYTTWLLLVGYIIALAVYAFTFGHYSANILALGSVWPQLFSVFILLLFLLINLRGVASSALTEDVIVFVKLFILILITGIGIWHFSDDRLTPLISTGISNIFLAATSIFVAYEGFELLSYDYEDIQDPKKNIPRALYASVLIVVATYVLVTIGSQMLLTDTQIVAQKEVAFTSVGRAALGVPGQWIAAFAAVLATSSAINATLFSTARQVHDVADSGELPKSFAKQANGLPTRALVVLAASGAAISLIPSITVLLTLGSFVFLMVFGLVNYLAHRTATGFFDRFSALVATVSCFAATAILVSELVRHDHVSLTLIAVTLLITLIARLSYKKRASNSTRKVSSNT